MSPNSLGGLGSLGGELDSVTGIMGISFADPDPVMPGSGSVSFLHRTGSVLKLDLNPDLKKISDPDPNKIIKIPTLAVNPNPVGVGTFPM